MIQATDLTGVDASVASRIISTARSITPCLDTLVDPYRAEAIQILIAVAPPAGGGGSRYIKSQRVGSAAVEYTGVSTWFSDDDRAALRALCASATSGAGPLGFFPTATPVVSGLWPEES